MDCVPETDAIGDGGPGCKRGDLEQADGLSKAQERFFHPQKAQGAVQLWRWARTWSQRSSALSYVPKDARDREEDSTSRAIHEPNEPPETVHA